MDIQTMKIDLIHWLTELQDQKVLEKLKAFNDQQEGLSESHQALLDDRIAAYKANPKNTLDWDEVMKELDKKQGVTRSSCFLKPV
ncbi:addiction module protein [Echinicola marina]|uniref:addiction module protein n=1 Tax=Echinicola marina TaxID=2859768 RepID=UPI001CF6A940|nr:addiction module protein [Echinicola marina]UCS94992.1 addiction module protein [Echinicola marina]